MCSTHVNKDIVIEDIVNNTKLNIYQRIFDKNNKNIKNFTLDLLKYQYNCQKDFDDVLIILRRKYKFHPKKSDISCCYYTLLNDNEIIQNNNLEYYLMTKRMRSLSGVLVVSLIMPPDKFSCKFNCHYCPNDPRLSRSYVMNEPTVMRGFQNDWCPIKQFNERINTYIINGHPIDKIEIIILGGSFCSYDKILAETFIRDIYYAANTIFDSIKREKLYINQEIHNNENAICKIIGMSVETHPRTICKNELIRFRNYGITRIQLGIQHTDNDILKKVNRKCTIENTMKAIEMIKDSCFKVESHIMLDLPFSSVEKDKEMLNNILYNKYLQTDYLKIYPTSIVDFTEIKKWYDEGTYKPYFDTDINKVIDLCIYFKERIPRYVRISRLQRDIPSNQILAGSSCSNLRQLVKDKMDKHNKRCLCIRCNEVKENISYVNKARLTCLKYDSSNGIEYFLSFNTCSCLFCWRYFIYLIISYISFFLFGIILSWKGCPNDNILYGFLRLRITTNSNKYFEILRKKGLIRELHVYGLVIPTYAKDNKNKKSQHSGFGKKLIKEAERISKLSNCNGLAVISGVGVRNYYRELDFIDNNYPGNYLIKYFT